MYQGTTIEKLIATVERAEQQVNTEKLPRIVPPKSMGGYEAVAPLICEWPRKQVVIGVA